MTFEERMVQVKLEPYKIYNENLNKVQYNPQADDIEDVLILTAACAVLGNTKSFEKLKFLLEQYDAIRTNLIYKYYYNTVMRSRYYYLKDYATALHFNVRANEVANQLMNPKLIAQSLSYLAPIYFMGKDIEMASYYINKAIESLDNIYAPLLTGDCYMTYGVILIEKNEYKHAIELYTKAKHCYEQVDGYERYSNYTILLLNLFSLYNIIKEIEQAELYLYEAINLAEKYDHLIFLDRSLKEIANFFEGKGDFENALKFLHLYTNNYTRVSRAQLPLEAAHDRKQVMVDLEQMTLVEDKNRVLMNRLKELHKSLDAESEQQDKNAKLELELHDALSNDEIEVFYQAKWSVNEDQIVGAEALIRWIKDGEIIPPGVFIEYVEESQIIIELSLKVIRQSIRVCKKIVGEINPNFIMSVNIAPYQLANQELRKVIENELLLHDLPPRNFDIEITERSLIDNNPKILEELYNIKGLGVQISLDDFGTGFSSLSCINSVPIDVVKIDRSLVENLCEGNRCYKLINGLIKLIKSLEILVVVEGVETFDQVGILREIGADYLQGYYYSRPIDSKSFINKLK